MIVEYNRPKTLEEALALLSRSEPMTLPLAGGTWLNRPSLEPIAVVDLQDLALDGITSRGSWFDLGAMTTLQALLDATGLPPALLRAVEHEATYNLRQKATVAGTLVSAGGRSPFATAMLAMDASLAIAPGDEAVSLGDLLPFRGERLRCRLVTQVTIPGNARLAYEYVARTPADLPIVCVAAAAWPSGRTRVALGGYGAAPVLAFDGTEPGGADTAAANAYSQADDDWADADFRMDVAAVLTRRCLEAIR